MTNTHHLLTQMLKSAVVIHELWLLWLS